MSRSCAIFVQLSLIGPQGVCIQLTFCCLESNIILYYRWVLSASLRRICQHFQYAVSMSFSFFGLICYIHGVLYTEKLQSDRITAAAIRAQGIYCRSPHHALDRHASVCILFLYKVIHVCLIECTLMVQCLVELYIR